MNEKIKSESAWWDEILYEISINLYFHKKILRNFRLPSIPRKSHSQDFFYLDYTWQNQAKTLIRREFLKTKISTDFDLSIIEVWPRGIRKTQNFNTWSINPQKVCILFIFIPLVAQHYCHLGIVIYKLFHPDVGSFIDA